MVNFLDSPAHSIGNIQVYEHCRVFGWQWPIRCDQGMTVTGWLLDILSFCVAIDFSPFSWQPGSLSNSKHKHADQWKCCVCINVSISCYCCLLLLLLLLCNAINHYRYFSGCKMMVVKVGRGGVRAQESCSSRHNSHHNINSVILLRHGMDMSFPFGV